MSDPTPAPESGTLLSRYRLGEKLGAGGMGVVYRAFDTRLERTVALKLLPPEAVGDADRRERFVREAKAASALNHAHIVTVYDIDRVATESGEVDLIAMELVEGETLDQTLERGALPIERALDLALQLTDALATAHRAGIVHRDVKPGNLMLAADGNLKLLDFGLSRFAPSGAVDAAALTVPHGLTTTGALIGTPAYMAPEQAEGRIVDARADVFAAGAVLYEMLSGGRPFAADTHVGQLLAVLRDVPPPLRTLRPDTPPELERIVERCLAKRPDERYPSANELHDELAGLRARSYADRASLGGLLRRPAVALPLALAAATLIVAALFVARARSTIARARAELPRLEQLVDRQELYAAFLLARRLAPILGDDRELARQLGRATMPRAIRSEPAGVTVSIRNYLDLASPWVEVGTTPIETVLLPQGLLRWRLEKPGFATLEAAPLGHVESNGFSQSFELLRDGEAPAGMLRVPAGEGSVPVDAFWLARHEVTNRDYQAFVDAGGYREPSYWREPFRGGGRELSWQEAIAGFVDSTGRPGPASWELGSYPEGTAEHPVGGVSWFEASAYAAWAGAEVPTVHHWLRATQQGPFSDILLVSNFGDRGLLPVGTTGGLGPFGHLDMAGNVFEWCANEGEVGTRLLAGSAWNEAPYTYQVPVQLSPFDRAPSRGLRLARYDSPPHSDLLAPRVRIPPDFDRRVAASDELFAVFRSLYAYERSPLAFEVDSVDDSSTRFRWERVSYAAAYGGERILAHLLLPKNAQPPFQAVVYFPSSPAERLASSAGLHDQRSFDFVMRSGRALLLPIYKNTYERRIPGWTSSPTARRDLVIAWARDLGRSVDFLESRPDIDADRLAFYGNSLGAIWGPLLTAVEPRFAASILLGGGHIDSKRLLPEADPFHFVPRVRTPTLMLSGRDDFLRPVEIFQRPMLRQLGLPDDRKSLVLLDGGHVPLDMNGVIREVLAWLDRWLGPVEISAR